MTVLEAQAVDVALRICVFLHLYTGTITGLPLAGSSGMTNNAIRSLWK